MRDAAFDLELQLAKWLTREVGEDRADRAIAFIQTCVVATFDTATADASVYATALMHEAELRKPVCANAS